MTRLEQAIIFATTAHEGQQRSGAARLPYIVHPLDVMGRLVRAGVTDEVVLAAAVLHDVVEDTGVTVEMILDEFGLDVANVVAEVTDPEGVSKTKARALQVERAPKMSARAKLVKLADKVSNVADLVANPPDWQPGSIGRYTDHARRVVAALGELPLGGKFFGPAARLREDFVRACRLVPDD
jgi:guanosine-3',5'-bis(diphosphate) 3'-pyrophosphohydrolase